MKQVTTPEVEIKKTTSQDAVAMRHMHAKSWRATYPSEEHGVSQEWVDTETESWLTPEKLEKSVSFLANLLTNSAENFHEVAYANGKVVGFIHGSTKQGEQLMEGLYLDPDYIGTGLGKRFMDDLLSWFDTTEDIVLKVASYNERAKAFYRKNGFEEVPGTEGMFKDKIPDIQMLRKGDKDEV